jgi:hypothetical protein
MTKVRSQRYLVLVILLVALIIIRFFRVMDADPEGILAVENTFAQNSPHRPRVDQLVEAVRQQHYYTAVSGLQWLRTDPNLTLEQITALQDAIGKIQLRLATQADNGDKTAIRHLQALQNETDYKNKPE